MVVGIGLAILTCPHIEEGKVPNSMGGSQDALLPTPIGWEINQTITLTMRIMQSWTKAGAHGMTIFLKHKLTAAVSTT